MKHVRHAIALALAGLVVSLAGPSSPAHAVGGNDLVLINRQEVDFALFIDPVLHEPTGAGGILYWQRSALTSTYTPRLVGLLSINSGYSGCGMLRLTAYDSLGNELESVDSSFLCTTTQSLWVTAAVDLPLPPVSFATRKVVVTAFTGAPWNYSEEMSVTLKP